MQHPSLENIKSHKYDDIYDHVGKNISFLAASASRAAIHKTFAVHENLADITAKTGSQCILGEKIDLN